MMPIPWTTLGFVFAAAVAAMFCLFLARAFFRIRIGWVDALWAYGVGAAGLYYVWTHGSDTLRNVVVSVPIVAWCGRLGTSLLFRYVGNDKDDPRYQDVEESCGGPRSAGMLAMYLGQGLIVTLFGLPAGIAALQGGPLGILGWIGVTLALGAILGETIADRQLDAFKRSSEASSGVCRRGLWAWSRHPNYFFEWLHWWGYVLLAIGGGWWWFAMLLGPGLMYIFLRYLSGIPWAERRSLRKRGEAYARYQREVPAFFPRPPQGSS